MLRAKKARCVVHMTPMKQYFGILMLFQPHLLMAPHEQIGKNRGLGGAHGYTIDLIIKCAGLKQEVG